MGEDAKVAVRNLRRDVNDKVKKMEKDGELTGDELKKGLDHVQKMTDDGIKKIDEMISKKEKEVLGIMHNMRILPDVASLKMPAAAEYSARQAYLIESRNYGLTRSEERKVKRREMRVVRQRETADHTLILSICSIYE